MRILPIIDGNSAGVVDLKIRIRYFSFDFNRHFCVDITHLATKNSTTDTPRYVVTMYSHTSADSGFINENSSGGVFLGFANKMLTPNVMKGIVKSTALRLSYVIVKSHIAKSARLSSSSLIKPFHFFVFRLNEPCALSGTGSSRYWNLRILAMPSIKSNEYPSKRALPSK